ncbi:hypothetical protein CHARACLAT_023359 [Characodon lateralis]|uniref:Uncharacterized protein n=1 Tax=Characodon lateralis TaxID=208331 RepID=A0ABU7EWM0_9TELE|nr:hypothetical protein [Characodon lateralis]
MCYLSSDKHFSYLSSPLYSHTVASLTSTSSFILFLTGFLFLSQMLRCAPPFHLGLFLRDVQFFLQVLTERRKQAAEKIGLLCKGGGHCVKGIKGKRTETIKHDHHSNRAHSRKEKGNGK